MASPSVGEIGRQLGRLFSAGSAVGFTDGELIERFTDRRGESVEAAFDSDAIEHDELHALLHDEVNRLPAIKMAAAALSLILMTAGLGSVLRELLAAAPQRPNPAPVAAARPPSTPVDRFGDPLPKSARAGDGPFQRGHFCRVAGPLHPRWQISGHSQWEPCRTRLGRSHRTDRAYHRQSREPVPRDRDFCQRRGDGDDRRSPWWPPALGPCLGPRASAMARDEGSDLPSSDLLSRRIDPRLDHTREDEHMAANAGRDPYVGCRPRH
jgi:hypothetical protein